jgi:hypothetical protein
MITFGALFPSLSPPTSLSTSKSRTNTTKEVKDLDKTPVKQPRNFNKFLRQLTSFIFGAFEMICEWSAAVDESSGHVFFQSARLSKAYEAQGSAEKILSQELHA